MKWSFANVGVIIFGLIGILIITFLTELTVSNEQDYFSMNDAAEAAMIEAVDVAYYRLTGDIKISKEKFVENFTRRFTEVSTYGEGNYKIEFYDISESPPKISVRIVDATNSYNIFNNFSVEIDETSVEIVNEITGILDIYNYNIEGNENNNNNSTNTSNINIKNISTNKKGKKFITIMNDDGSTDSYVASDNISDTFDITEDECEQIDSNTIECNDDGTVETFKKETKNSENKNTSNKKFIVHKVFNYTNLDTKSFIPKYKFYIYYDENYYYNNDNTYNEGQQIYCIKSDSSLICVNDASSYETINVLRAAGEATIFKSTTKDSLCCYEHGYSYYLANYDTNEYGGYGFKCNVNENGSSIYSYLDLMDIDISDVVFTSGISKCNGNLCQNIKVDDYILAEQYSNFIIGKKSNICS